MSYRKLRKGDCCATVSVIKGGCCATVSVINGGCCATVSAIKCWLSIHTVNSSYVYSESKLQGTKLILSDSL